MSEVLITDWVAAYEPSLQGKARGTQATYRRALVHLTQWIGLRQVFDQETGIRNF